MLPLQCYICRCHICYCTVIYLLLHCYMSNCNVTYVNCIVLLSQCCICRHTLSLKWVELYQSFFHSLILHSSESVPIANRFLSHLSIFNPQKPQLHASGELFVKLLRALAKQCGNVMDDGAVPIGSPIPFLSSSVPTTLSNSMSSLCSAHPIAEADHHDLSASVGTRRFRHCSANQTTTSRGGAFGKKAGAKR